MSPGTDRVLRVVQGEFGVSADPMASFVTVLGSCVAVCLRDPVVGVGGMNHFLLPGEAAGADSALRYGAHLMELLINDLMKAGADRRRLEAKAFGGGRINRTLSDIGAKNAAFARQYLENEGLRLVASDLGGDEGRRLQYWPTTGRALVSRFSAELSELNERPPRRSASPCQIDLFTATR
ncbi:MAG: chemotaxis protein CheD [Hyphomicrobiales bacterium]|nr:chemotaxis protein CheD [Hyphomicrobiales bacterium]